MSVGIGECHPAGRVRARQLASARLVWLHMLRGQGLISSCRQFLRACMPLMSVIKENFVRVALMPHAAVCVDGFCRDTVQQTRSFLLWYLLKYLDI